MDLARVFVLNLKKWRKASGLSQKRLAEKCGAAHSYIRQIENGVGTPSFAMLTKIAEALGIEPYLLLYDETSSHGRAVHERYLESVKGKLLEAITDDIRSAFDDLKNAGGVPPCNDEQPP